MLCPAHMLGYLYAIRPTTWARRRHSERSLPVFLFHPSRIVRRMPADAVEEPLLAVPHAAPSACEVPGPSRLLKKMGNRENPARLLR